MMKCNASNLEEFEQFCEKKNERSNTSIDNIRKSKDIVLGVGSSVINYSRPKKRSMRNSFHTIEHNNGSHVNVCASQQELPKMSTIELEKKVNSVDTKSTEYKDSYPKFMYNSI